eukprot:Protomagalhaensia_sp_Gyna_25__2246@NODE_2225_length_1212_cov_50_283887_g1845_i0_p1_GENE_NODE_2225_length_1212_cov_50_283887_g1845_i0NODE_2225_length_1212_cov_50_283887_g1845_i0_p1_ORF_typecomplete_len343_score32_25GCD14/PF08704_10/9_9e58Methyltransf_31/PF13847_6/8_8e08GCD14_N/PF14801_6/2_5e07GCD14_N/PF14801_6/1_9e03Methyltransf_3/PF01596_17/1_6e06PCMT/PF01135_19/4_9e05Methyltransf_24/PF13578_6/0_0092MTS/PF05175_14/0_025Ubie_methyltran/PF01209_18/0_15Methyltransf_4/PF02390_17/0_15VirD1/PF07328_11
MSSFLSFLWRMKACAEENDYVILFSTHDSLVKARLTPGGITQFKGGKFRHNDIIGKAFGSRIPDLKTPTITTVLLSWTPELHSLSLDHRTQILWAPDISLISAYLGTRAGFVLVESGTGSGSASVNFARQLGPKGKLHTFEFHPDRYERSVKEFAELGFDDRIVCYNRDAYEDGFSAVSEGHKEYGTERQNGVGKEEADGVFLDLPSPWLAFKHVDYVLKPSCRLVVFSPCFEQVQTTAEELRKMHYNEIEGFEVICKPMGLWTRDDAQRRAVRVVNSQTRNFQDNKTTKPPKTEEELMDTTGVDCVFEYAPYTVYHLPQKGHTGYVIVARKGPADELEAML